MSAQTADGKWAVILCGGRGSRMGGLTENTPKPLVQVHGKPILWFSFLTLYKHGVRHFIFPLGYKGEMIRQYMQAITQNLDCTIHCVETGEDTSIARRILQVKDLIPEHTDFFLINSDTIFDFDIEAMHQVHRNADALVTLSSVEVVSAWGLILMNGGEMVSFDRNRKVRHLTSNDLPGIHGVVNSGLAWLNKDALAHVDMEACADFETSLYQKVIAMRRAAHYQIRGYWYPIDTPKDLHVINLAVEDKDATGHAAKAVRDALGTVASIAEMEAGHEG